MEWVSYLKFCRCEADISVSGMSNSRGPEGRDDLEMFGLGVGAWGDCVVLKLSSLRMTQRTSPASDFEPCLQAVGLGGVWKHAFLTSPQGMKPVTRCPGSEHHCVLRNHKESLVCGWTVGNEAEEEAGPWDSPWKESRTQTWWTDHCGSFGPC